MKDFKEYVNKSVVIIYKESPNSEVSTIKCRVKEVDDTFVHVEGFNDRHLSINKILILIIKEGVHNGK